MHSYRALAAAAVLASTFGCASSHAQSPHDARAPEAAASGEAASKEAEKSGAVATVADAGSPYFDLEALEPGQIVHVPTGTLLNEDELYGYLAPLRVVYVGEAHDSVEDHRVQLDVLEAMHARRGGRVAIGLEMLSRDLQAAADAWVAGEMDEKAFSAVWEESWSPHSWPFYRDILRFARAKKIPVVALNAEDALVKAVSQEGLEGLDESQRAKLPDMDLEDPWHRAVVKGIFSGHGHGGAMADRFVEVQALWDETMADTAARFLESESGRDRQLLVFAGGFHIRYGIGIPRRVFRRVALPYATIEPWAAVVTAEKQDQLMDVEVPDLPMPVADVVWGVTYREPDFERAVLGLQVAPAEQGAKAGQGVKVLGVVPEGPAAAAGVREGDVVVAVDGEPVSKLSDLSWIASERAPGDAGELRLMREEAPLVLPFTWGAAASLERHGDDAPEEAAPGEAAPGEAAPGEAAPPEPPAEKAPAEVAPPADG